VALVSDAVPPAGLADGAYPVWGETLVLKESAVRNAAGALAGSGCLLPEALRRLERAGFPFDEVTRMASEVPRRILAG
jgi:N-acetylglucosamine-6-phosphate deacetylase